MRRDPRAYLADIIDACEAVTRFVMGRDYASYLSDEMLRSAVERQLEIIGEALNRLRQTDADLSARVPDSPAIIGFRNVLIHGYDIVDQEVVWRTVVNDVPRLARSAAGLLADLGDLDAR